MSIYSNHLNSTITHKYLSWIKVNRNLVYPSTLWHWWLCNKNGIRIINSGSKNPQKQTFVAPSLSWSVSGKIGQLSKTESKSSKCRSKMQKSLGIAIPWRCSLWKAMITTRLGFKHTMLCSCEAAAEHKTKCCIETNKYESTRVPPGL